MRKLIIALALFFTYYVINAQFINNGATITVQPGSTLRIESDFQNNGTGTVTNNGTIEVMGNFTNASSATLTPSVGLIKFIGTGNANLNTGGDALNNVEMAKTSNATVTLTAPVSITGNLSFTGSGSKIDIGAFDLTLGSSSIVNTPGAAGYVITSSTGNFVKKVAADGSFTFPVGDDGTDYSPLAMTYTGTGYSGTSAIKAKVIDAVHPDKPSFVTSYLSRYWKVESSNISSPFNADYTGTYLPADVNGTQADIVGATYVSPNWSYTNASTNGSSTVSGSSGSFVPDFSGLNKFAKLDLTAFIEGYMDGTSMRPVLLNSGLSYPATDCDNLTVALHDATSPFSQAHSYTGILKTNGTMSCVFPGTAVANSYYIVIKHRNALQTWSTSPVSMSVYNNYNFSTASSQAYGDNMVQVNGLWCMYSGDIDAAVGDGNIDLIDYPVWETDNNNYESGYRQADLNGDGNVDLIDYPIWEANNNNYIFVIKP
ncbi:MAG: hypothetical protein ACM3PT_04145 [Deltaproteobacteria bacterium]